MSLPVPEYVNLSTAACAGRVCIWYLPQRSIKSAVIQAPFYYGKTIIITSSLCHRLSGGHQQSRQRRWTAGHYFNQTVIWGWLDCFPPQQRHVPSCPSVCLPVHLVWSVGTSVQSVSSSLPGWTAKATHLTSGQLSKQDTPFTLTPRGREAIDNSLRAASQFVHFWNWPWTHQPLTGVEWIRNTGDGGGYGRSFFKLKKNTL